MVRKNGSLLVPSLVLFLGVSHGTAVADETPKAHYSVGTDLSPWFLEGYSAMVFVEPTTLPDWRFGAELWSMRLPEFAVRLGNGNETHDFSHDVRIAGVFYADRSLGATPWHLGALVNVMRAQISRNDAHGDVTIGEILGRVGYRFLPMGPRGIFVDPWFGMGPQKAFGALPVLEGKRYALFPLQIIATVHVGYRF